METTHKCTDIDDVMMLCLVFKYLLISIRFQTL